MPNVHILERRVPCRRHRWGGFTRLTSVMALEAKLFLSLGYRLEWICSTSQMATGWRIGLRVCVIFQGGGGLAGTACFEDVVHSQEQESNYFSEVLVPVLIGTVSVPSSQAVAKKSLQLAELAVRGAQKQSAQMVWTENNPLLVETSKSPSTKCSKRKNKQHSEVRGSLPGNAPSKISKAFKQRGPLCQRSGNSFEIKKGNRDCGAPQNMLPTE